MTTLHDLLDVASRSATTDGREHVHDLQAELRLGRRALRRRRITAAAGVAAVGLAVGGIVGGAVALDSPPAASPASSTVTGAIEPTGSAPASAWLPEADVTGAALNLARGGDVVVLKTASWCLPCGGEEFLADIRAAAKENPQTTVIVMLVRESAEMAGQIAADLATLTNVRVVTGELSTGAVEVSKAFGGGLPAVALLTGDVVTESAMGKSDVARLIAAK